jgi:hypothetical protein
LASPHDRAIDQVLAECFFHVVDETWTDETLDLDGDAASRLLGRDEPFRAEIHVVIPFAPPQTERVGGDRPGILDQSAANVVVVDILDTHSSAGPLSYTQSIVSRG